MGTKKIDVIQSANIAALEADVLELRTKINLVVTDAIAMSAKLNTLIDDLNDMNDVVMKGYTTPSSSESYGILKALDVYKDAMTDHLESFMGRWGAENGTWSGGGTGTWSACQVEGPWLTGTEWQTWPTEVLIGHGTGGSTEPTSLKHDSPAPYDVEMFNYNGSQYADSHKFYVEHPPALLMDCGSANSGSARTGGNVGTNSGTAGYGSPVVNGTGQSGNTSHDPDATDAREMQAYGNLARIMTVKASSARRAKKLARKTLNRLRK